MVSQPAQLAAKKVSTDPVDNSRDNLFNWVSKGAKSSLLANWLKFNQLINIVVIQLFVVLR